MAPPWGRGRRTRGGLRPRAGALRPRAGAWLLHGGGGAPTGGGAGECDVLKLVSSRVSWSLVPRRGTGRTPRRERQGGQRPPLPLPGQASPTVSLPLRPGQSIIGVHSVLSPPGTAQPRGDLPPSSHFQGYLGNLRAGPGGLASSAGGAEFKSRETATLLAESVCPGSHQQVLATPQVWLHLSSVLAAGAVQCDPSLSGILDPFCPFAPKSARLSLSASAQRCLSCFHISELPPAQIPRAAVTMEGPFSVQS